MYGHRITKKELVLFAIFIALLASNIIFFGLLLDYYFNNVKVIIDIDVNNIFSFIATIIIFGFISTRLPQFRKMGDSSLYEIGYLIIIGLLSIVVSIFNRSTHADDFIFPFLEIFKVLSVLLIFVIIATKTKTFKNILKGNPSKSDLIKALIIFSLLGCLASLYQIPIHDSAANVREMIVLVSGLFGGPFVGIPTGIIAGGFRFLEGGATAVPCSLSTVISGALGSLIYICNNKKFLRGFPAVVLMFLFTGFSMLVILMLTPPDISVAYVNDIYPLMVFASVLGIILFIMILKEQKPKKDELSYAELRINELENTLEEYESRIDSLEEDIEVLKNKFDD